MEIYRGGPPWEDLLSQEGRDSVVGAAFLYLQMNLLSLEEPVQDSYCLLFYDSASIVHVQEDNQPTSARIYGSLHLFLKKSFNGHRPKLVCAYGR